MAIRMTVRYEVVNHACTVTVDDIKHISCQDSLIMPDDGSASTPVIWLGNHSNHVCADQKAVVNA